MDRQETKNCSLSIQFQAHYFFQYFFYRQCVQNKIQTNFKIQVADFDFVLVHKS